MKRLALTLSVLAVTAGALPASASACTGEGMTQMFQELDGDARYYFVAPGGTFESRTTSVTVTGTTKYIVPDHRVTRAGLQGALTMASGATVTTGVVCVDAARQYMRFLYRRRTASGTMKVEAIRSNGTKVLLANVSPTRSLVWIGSSLVPLAGPLSIPLSTDVLVKLRLTATGSWDIDGVAVDPYRRA